MLESGEDRFSRTADYSLAIAALDARNPRYSTKLLPTQVTPSLYRLTDGSIYTTSQITKITFIYLCIYIFLNLKDHPILGLSWP